MTTSSSTANLFMMINYQLAVFNLTFLKIGRQSSAFSSLPSIKFSLNLYLGRTRLALLFLISRRLVQKLAKWAEEFLKKSFSDRSVDPACLGLPTRLTGSGVTGGAAEAAPALLPSLLPPSYLRRGIFYSFTAYLLMFLLIACSLSTVKFQWLCLRKNSPRLWLTLAYSAVVVGGLVRERSIHHLNPTNLVLWIDFFLHQ